MYMVYVIMYMKLHT